MRVLHLIDSEGFYGAEKMVLSLACESTKLGHSATIGLVSYGDSNEVFKAAARRENVPIVQLPMGRGISLKGTRQILEYGRARDTDIIHSHSYKPNILLGCVPRSRRPCPVIATMHGRTSPKHLKRLWIYQAIERMLLRRLNGVVFVDKRTEERLRNHVQRGASYHIPNGIGFPEAGLPEADGAAESELPVRKPYLLAIGRLSYEKGFDLLLAALRKLRDSGQLVELVIVGEGSERGRLIDQVRQLDLSSAVHLPGFRQDLSVYLHNATAMVMPSRSEGLPLALLETMAWEVPVIASAVGEIPTVLDNGELGTLIEPGSVQSIVAAIQEHLDDPDHKIQRAKMASAKVRSDYSSESMARRYHEVYSTVVS